MAEGTCQFCGRPTATDICPAHGYVGKVREKEVDAIPLGLIAIWSGTLATIPAKWALCNGQNGTPNLQDKFVMGGGSTAPGASGGSNAHTHTVTSSGTIAGSGSGTSGNNSANETCGYGYEGDHAAWWTYDAGAHDHGATTGNCSATNVALTGSLDRAAANHTHSIPNQAAHAHSQPALGHSGHAHTMSGTHTHSLSETLSGTCSTSGTAASGGVGVAYYTLAFIMKVG